MPYLVKVGDYTSIYKNHVFGFKEAWPYLETKLSGEGGIISLVGMVEHCSSITHIIVLLMAILHF